MNSSILSRLTLVMPTYNRQSYALRNIRYWSGRGVTLLVVDGSPLAIPAPLLASFADNIHYHHLPIAMVARLSYAVDEIDTEYTAMMGDDEFFIPSALEACIRELDTQIDLISCMGRCLEFNTSPTGIIGSVGYPQMADYAILEDDPIERMVAHMKNYTPSTIYSVTRSQQWRRAMSAFTQREFPAYAIGELQFELAVCCQGKSKVIPELMWLRSSEMPAIRGTDPWLKPEATLRGWWQDRANRNEHAEFLTIMSTTLATAGNEVIEISLGVKKAIDTYLEFTANKLTTFQRIRLQILRYLPVTFKTILKAFFKLIENRLTMRASPMPPLTAPRLLMAVAKDLSIAGVKIDFEELSNIVSIVSAFHTNRQEIA